MSESSYMTILNKVEEVLIVKKSRFIGIAFPCTSEEDFISELEHIKKQYSGANHYCYAYRLIGQVMIERYQDNGEPSGTAGMPMLEVLRGQDLKMCAVVVVRYFGGTKLGTGGLSRAYSDSTRNVINLCDIVSKEEVSYQIIKAEYTLTGKLDYYINTHHIPVLETDYSDLVGIKVVLKMNQIEKVINDLQEFSSGTLIFEDLGSYTGYFIDNKFIEG